MLLMNKVKLIFTVALLVAWSHPAAGAGPAFPSFPNP
jgi:hypothetical protein